jgi:hypothetical protein
MGATAENFNQNAKRDEKTKFLRLEREKDGTVYAVMREPPAAETKWTEKALMEQILWMQRPENRVNREVSKMDPGEFQKALVQLQNFKIKHNIPLDVGKFDPNKKKGPGHAAPK